MGYIYKTLPFDIAKSSIALFLMEVLNIVVKEEEKNERMFDFIEQSIIALDSNTNSDANFHLKFLIELTGYLGFSPSYANKKSKQFFDLKEGGFVEEIPQHPYFLNQRESLLFDLLLSDHQEIMATRNERNSVLGKILQYYELHLPGWKKVNSHKILHEVLRPED